MRTTVPGVWAAGEAADSVFRQVVTSAGMGAAAAIAADRWLSEHDSDEAPTAELFSQQAETAA
jgi:thioredoxin reductase (NADPH)